MLTKEKRAAIAERLSACDYLYDNALYQVLFGHNVPSYTTFEDDSKAILERLADLIDPTCHMSWEYGNGDDETDEYMDEIAGTTEDTVACHCHECDEVFRYDRGIIPNYCPSCGARVVRDEA